MITEYLQIESEDCILSGTVMRLLWPFTLGECRFACRLVAAVTVMAEKSDGTTWLPRCLNEFKIFIRKDVP